MFKQIYTSYMLYVLIIFGKLSTSLTDDEFEDKLYSNKWVVRVEGGLDEANRIAARHGFKNLGQVMFHTITIVYLNLNFLNELKSCFVCKHRIDVLNFSRCEWKL